MLYPDTSRFSTSFKNYLKSNAHFEHYSKRKTLLSPSEINNKVWYIQKGVAKIYHYTFDDQYNKKEIISCFLKEHDTICCVDTLFGRETNQEYIELIEDCNLYVLTQAQLDDCFKLFAEAHAVAREIILGYKQKAELRLHLLSLPAKERLKEFSKLFNTGRLSVADLSAYLGVSRTHLNRIRKAK